MPNKSSKVSMSIHDIIKVIGGRSFIAAKIPAVKKNHENYFESKFLARDVARVERGQEVSAEQS